MKKTTLLFCIILMIACDNPQKSEKNQAIQTEPVEEQIVLQNGQDSDSIKTDTLSQKEKKRKVSPPQISDSYEEGYLDGETLSEEDRLAGKPGMQGGMDDDEEDYEDGYDDGYEEE